MCASSAAVAEAGPASSLPTIAAELPQLQLPTTAVVVDPTGDAVGGSNPAGDLTTMQAAESVSPRWLSAYTATYTDPTTTPAWTELGSTVAWELDTNRDGVADEIATFTGGTEPEVNIRLASTGEVVCTIVSPYVQWGVGLYGTPNQGAGYGVQVDKWCLLDAPTLGIRATVTYHPANGVTQTDSAPDTGTAVFGKDRVSAAPVLVSRARWYNGAGRTLFDTDNYFGNPGDLAVDSAGGVVFPDGPLTGFLATRKVVMRPDTPGGPTFFRQFRTDPPFTSTSAEYVKSFQWGDPADVPVSGDWNGDGFDTLGLFRPSTGQWFLTDDTSFANLSSQSVTTLAFGSPGDVPVAGDWTGAGPETPGVFRAGRWYMLATLHSGVADMSILFGNPGDVPVPGHWTGNALTTVGVWRAGTWYLADTLTNPIAVGFYSGGEEGDQFMTAPIY